MVTKEEKLVQLKEYLQSLGSVAVAFSSGVDSTFLLKVAQEVLGDKVLAVTARSCSFPQRELSAAENFVKEHNIAHVIVDSEELGIDGFAQNPPNRCYLCKTELFTKIKALALAKGFAAVAEGSNMDDLGDYRPGLEAIKELGIKSPLRQAGLYKEEIRLLSKELGLATWEKPSFACLASRFPYGEEITPEKLSMVDQAEQFLLDLDFRQVRVRHHGTLARIEVEEAELDRMLKAEVRKQVHEYLKQLGFLYVTVDLMGYRTGSMNDTLSDL